LDAFRQHLWQTVGIGEASKDKNAFERGFFRAFPEAVPINHQFDMLERLRRGLNQGSERAETGRRSESTDRSPEAAAAPPRHRTEIPYLGRQGANQLADAGHVFRQAVEIAHPRNLSCRRLVVESLAEVRGLGSPSAFQDCARPAVSPSHGGATCPVVAR